MHAQQGVEHTVTQNEHFCQVNNKFHIPFETTLPARGPDMSKYIMYTTKQGN